ncbi:hypothetical protein SAMN05443549_10330 [Flavobacterium fluvii]|uniref:Uncharacterized protein n=2 Tax=Flavobacterium fluvii TaxID=468056 RepID=A0A1M5ICG1_9FLAO|nr:hypothetical protein SAMN05443549_10330 [Flavobacterium fluvii]
MVDGFAIFFFLLIGFTSFSQVGINTTTPNSTFEVNGSNGQKVTMVTTNTTLDDTHSIVLCNNGAVAKTMTLPTAVGITGRIYSIKRGEASTADVTIATTSSQTIDGEMDYMLMNAKESVTIVSNGSNWNVVSTFVPQFPMGEISFFNGIPKIITISSPSNGSTNMVLCNPATALTTNMMGVGFDNGGANTGRLRYTGATTRVFHVACTISVGPIASNDQFVFGIARNGTVLSTSKVIQKTNNSGEIMSTALHIMVTLAQNEYLELYVGNMTAGRNVEIYSLNFFALGM